MLASLPPELLSHVYSLLSPSNVNQISLTCHSLYTSALPSLYSTIVLSFRKHIQQLETSLQHKESFLHHVMQQYTKEILLKCKQGGQHRLTFDIRSLLRRLPHIRTLTLVDFDRLPISYITLLLSLLPHLEHVSLRYCTLVSVPPSLTSLNNNNNNANSQLSTSMHSSSSSSSPSPSSLTSLELYWTDFTNTAIDVLLSALPCLTKVQLLANHNRYFLANNHALAALPHHCHHVKDLEIGLQEVFESTVVNCIMDYGEQIQRLSVRCHSPLILDTITHHASFVQDLIVRFSLDTLWYSSSSVPTQDILPSSPTIITSRSRHHHHQPIDDEETQEKNDNGGGGLLYLLSHCQHLEHVQVLSMSPTTSPTTPLYDTLPPIVSKALASVAQKRLFLRTNSNPRITTITNSNNNNRKKKQPSTSGDSDNRHHSKEIAPNKIVSSMDDGGDGMISGAAFTTQLTMKASSHHYHEQRKRNDEDDDDGQQQDNNDNNVLENDAMIVMTERPTQRRRQQQQQFSTPLAININAITQMYTMDFQQQSAKEHTRMESSLSLDNEQLNEIRSLASFM